MAKRKPEAEEQAKQAPVFTSIRLKTDTHMLLLKISAKRLLKSGRQESMDIITDDIVRDYCKRNYPDILES